MQTPEQLEILAKKAAQKTISLTTTVNEEIRAHLKSTAILQTDIGIGNKVWIEIALLGSYLMQKKAGDIMSPEEKNIFAPIFKKEFMASALDAVSGTSSIEKEGASLMIEADYDDKLTKYSSSAGDTAVLFRDELKKLFTKPSKIKLNENAWRNKIMEKTTYVLGALGQPASGKDAPAIPDNILTAIAESSVRLFQLAPLYDV